MARLDKVARDINLAFFSEWLDVLVSHGIGAHLECFGQLPAVDIREFLQIGQDE